MNIKNYTSTVAAERSVHAIEKLLVEAGAQQISKTYEQQTKRLTGIAFNATVSGRQLSFRLPARVERVHALMWQQVRRPRRETKDRVMDQAERTAWKILHDWVAVQVSLIQLQQAELVEVFLPYIYDPAKERTFFQHLKDGGFKLLMAGDHTVMESEP